MKSNLSRKKISKLINEKKPTLSSYFNSIPNAMKSNIMDTDSVDGMNKHIIDKLQKQLSQKQTLRDELIDVFETDRKTKAASFIKAQVRRKKSEPGILAMTSLLKKQIDMKQTTPEDTAATTISSVLRGHNGREEKQKD
jgi:hypothetical protein